MKILVTGGNGFIGKHVVNELVSRNIDVVSFDLVHPKTMIDGVQYVIGTIMDQFALGQAMRGCDAVFHLAALLGVKRAEVELLKCMDVNINGSLKVLEACVMNDVPHVVAASSSEIFGDISTQQVKEDSLFNPKSGYAVAKLAMEHYLEGFHKEYGLDFNIVRFFNIYGPGQVAEFVIPRFIKMVKSGIAPRVYGNGEQVRSYCHISDAARALVDIFLQGAAKNDSVNIGNDLEPITVKALAHKAIELVNKDLTPEYIDFEESDRRSSREIYYRVPDIAKLRHIIDYEPRVSLEEGLKRLIASDDIPESWVEPVISS